MRIPLRLFISNIEQIIVYWISERQSSSEKVLQKMIVNFRKLSRKIESVGVLEYVLKNS